MLECSRMPLWQPSWPGSSLVSGILYQCQDDLQAACQGFFLQWPWGQPPVSLWSDLAMRRAGLPIISEELKGYLAVRKCIHFKCVMSVFQKEMSVLISCPFAIAVWFQVREAYKTCLFFSLFRCLYFLELCWLIPFSDKQLWLEFLFHSTL